MEHIKGGELILQARYDDEKDGKGDNLVTFKVDMNMLPVDVLNIIFKKHSFKKKREDTHILKVYGQEEYIHGDYPIIQFLYVQVSSI